ALLKDHFEEKRDNALKIWGLLMLELWFQMYVDRRWDAPAENLAGIDWEQQPVFPGKTGEGF
ncbi:MAG TPA: hypothetical protein VKE71_11600, partial [Candidatus Angelobacter sp.]|nr:hypothetical protein [Candidatus Angelobacter sp.]